MVQKLNQLKESPSQTAGPLRPHRLRPELLRHRRASFREDLGATMVNDATRGERITDHRHRLRRHWHGAEGRAGRDLAGRRRRALSRATTRAGRPIPNFTGWGRKAGDYATGEWVFETIRSPAASPGRSGGMQAPHITFWIVARGINIGLHTRMYFPDEDNAADPILKRIEHQNRVPTLIAEKTGEGAYRFDIRIQGDGETIFFDF